MSALQMAAAAHEIDDQNRRMTGLVVALASGVFTALLSTMIWIY